MDRKNISEVEVSHIDTHGVWLCLEDKEYFLSYSDYPWFQESRVKEILSVELLHDTHLHWPLIDVDLEIDCLDNPQKYPLKYK
jgi:hypothetical protein